MAKKAPKAPKEEFPVFEEMFSSMFRKIDAIPKGSGTVTAISWGIVAAILIAISSLLFHFDIIGSPWIPAVLGTPAGLILFLIGAGIARRTSVREWDIFNMKQDYSFKQRLRKILIWGVVYIVIFIPFGRFVPYGIGGSIMILLVLTAVLAGYRTKEEILLAAQGLPDPRDLADQEAKDAYAEEVQEAPQADKTNGEKLTGFFGGKLK